MEFQEVELTISGNFVKINESDVFVSVDMQGCATFAGVNGNYTVQGTNFSIEEHPIHAPK
jgi:hypothetical protein